jgi:hypothetical protein
MNTPTIAEIEEAIRTPTRSWKGSCFAIADALVESDLLGVECAAVYGHWLGGSHPEGHFADRAAMPFIQHGWVMTEDGYVVDPTRWVFENEPPYLFTAKPDGNENWPYDEGGNKFRMSMLSPPPEFDGAAKLVEVDFGTAAGMVRSLLVSDNNVFTEGQLFWLANLSPNILGNQAQHVYAGLDKLGMIGCVPIDNQTRVKREAEWS